MANAPEIIKSTIKGSIQAKVWDGEYGVSVVLVKGYKPKNSSKWENLEMKLYPNEVEAAIEVLKAALKLCPEDDSENDHRKPKTSKGFGKETRDHAEEERPSRSTSRGRW